LIGQTKNKTRPEAPEGFAEVMEIGVGSDGMSFHVYTRIPKKP
jgi:hypothetical protein